MLTLKDVAKKLGISVSALRIRVGKGKFPAPDKRVGAQWYWHDTTVLHGKSDVDAMQATNRLRRDTSKRNAPVEYTLPSH